MQKNQTKKAALYIRVSTHYQIDKDSLPFQRNELINYAKYALGIDDYAIFEDAGYSGKNTDRPAYQDMMRRIRAKEFSHLCVWKIDRISRNLLDFAAMYEELKKFNCTFVSKNEQFDTSSAIGEAMLRIILVFAELERKLTAERVTSIMYSRANKGLWNGAPIPLGYLDFVKCIRQLQKHFLDFLRVLDEFPGTFRHPGHAVVPCFYPHLDVFVNVEVLRVLADFLGKILFFHGHDEVFARRRITFQFNRSGILVLTHTPPEVFTSLEKFLNHALPSKIEIALLIAAHSFFSRQDS